MHNLDETYLCDFRSWAIDAFLNTSWVDNPTFQWFNTKILDAATYAQNNTYKKDAPILIGVCGNAGCGKNAAVDFFTTHDLNPYLAQYSTQLAFADPIRKIGEIFGFSMEQMTDRVLKEAVDPRWGFSPRQFMQKVGTEMFRDHLREDIWIKLAMNNVAQLSSQPHVIQFGCPECVMGTYKFIFITDVRFPNEAAAIKEHGGIIVKIRREGFDKSGDHLHPSEKFIDSMECDLEICNDAPDLKTWQWVFARRLTRFFNKTAFFELNKIK